MSRRTLGTTLASILLPPGHAARPSRDASEDSDAPRPLTALAALIQEREALAKKRTIASVSWLPDVIRIQGSIVPHIIGPVLTVTLFAIFVAAATRFYDLPLRLSNSVVPLLSVVVGLLLVFRNGSAYERYSEGRKDFTALVSAARNLSRLVWIQVALPSGGFVQGRDLTVGGGDKAKLFGSRERMTAEVLRKEKIRFIKLVNAFVIAVKHHLRGEPGTSHEEYRDVLPPDFARYDTIADNYRTLSSTSTSMTPNASQDLTQSTLESQLLQPSPPKRKHHGFARHLRHLGGGLPSPPVDERTPFLRTREPSDWMDTVRPFNAAGGVSLPLPLVIAHEISRSLYAFRRKGALEVIGPAGVNAMQGLIQAMVDQMGAMERVVRTPLPPVFQAGPPEQSVTLYLFALPLVLVDDMGWLMVSVVSLVAFTLMGIEGIASQIENPFGTDDNDLPLDLEVAELRVELEYVFNTLPEGTDDEDVFSI